MQARLKALSIVAMSLVLASGARVMADDEDQLAKTPAAVQAVVKGVLGADGKLEGCETEQADGKPAYDIDMKVDGTSYAMLIGATGEVLQREVEVTTAMVPRAVLDAAAKAHPDGKKSEISIITKGDQMYYEVEMQIGKGEHDINISAGGNVLADTVAAPEAADANEEPEAGEKKD